MKKGFITLEPGIILPLHQIMKVGADQTVQTHLLLCRLHMSCIM